jgi:tetratricopeptide (TPR) repeat protein
MPVRVQCPNPDCQASFSIVEGEAPRFRRCPQCGWELSGIGTPDPNKPRSGELPQLRSAPGSPQLSGPAPGTTFAGRYEVIRQLGRGGMGAVYLAKDTRLDRQVAVKFPFLWGDDDPEYLQRFYREARAAAGLRHPNVCRVYDVDEHEGQPYLTMEYLEGVLLSSHLKTLSKPMELHEAIRLVRKLARVMDTAHRQGIVHRDLKPANIMLDPKVGPIVMDFGLARREDREESLRTRAGQQIGTPAYMSLEQFQGNVEKIGPRSDIYSLGVILFELLTGKRPYEGNAFEIHTKQVKSGPPAPSSLRPGIDPLLDAICRRAMSKNLNDRHPSMSDLAADLSSALQIYAPKRHALPALGRRRSLMLGLLVAAGLAVIPLAVYVSSTRHSTAPIPAKVSSQPPLQPRDTDVKNETAKDEETADSLLSRAESQLEQGQYDQAAKAFDRVIGLDAKSARALYGRGAALFEKKDYYHALEDLGEAIRLQPEKMARAHLIRARIHLAYETIKPAFDEYERAIKLDPSLSLPEKSKLAAAYLSRGNASRDQGELDAAIAAYGHAIHLNPDDPKCRAARGEAAYDKGNRDQAIADLSDSIKLDPHGVDALVKRGEIYRDAGRLRDAISDFSQAIVLVPTALKARCGRGLANYYAGNFDLAIADADSALTSKPDSVEALLVRAASNEEKGLYDEAIADCKKVLGLEAGSLLALGIRAQAHANRLDDDNALADAQAAWALDARSAVELNYRSEVLSFLCSDDRALLDLDKAIKLVPDYAVALGNRAGIYRRKGDLDRAMVDVERAIGLSAQVVGLHVQRARIRSAKGDSVQAIADWDAAVRLSADKPRFLRERGIAYRNKGECKRAVADFDHAIELEPGNARAYIDRAVAHRIRGDSQRATSDFETALGVQPKDAGVYAYRGQVLRYLGFQDQAIADYGEAIRLKPRHFVYYIHRASAYLEKKDFNRAIADYTAAIRLNPNYADAYRNRGSSFSQTDQFGRAVADYTELIRLDPNDAVAYSTRAHAHRENKEYDRAIADFTAVIRFDPKNATAYNSRGHVHLIRKDYDFAIADYTEAMRLQPDDPELLRDRAKAYAQKGDVKRAYADFVKAERMPRKD